MQLPIDVVPSLMLVTRLIMDFQASIHNCLNCVHNYDDHSLLDFKSAVLYI